MRLARVADRQMLEGVELMSDTVKWLSYEFTVYAPNAPWNQVAGVYIFCGLNAQNQWHAVYIGQTDSFANRIPSHEQWAAAVRLGATHVHARGVSEAATRDAVERELIQAYQPPLNTELK